MKLNTKPLSGIELGTPVIQEGLMHARLSVETKDNKAGTGQNLVVRAQVLDNPVYAYADSTEIENKGQINIYRYISLVETPNYDPDRAVKELAVAVGHPEDQDLELEHLQGQIVMIKVTYEPATAQYKASNGIGGFRPVPEDDAFEAPPL